MDQWVTFVLFLPFIVILFLANLADRRRERGASGTDLAALTYALLFFIYALFIMMGLVLHVVGIAGQMEGATDFGVDRELIQVMGRMGPAIWIPSLIGLLLLLSPLRRLAARLIPTFNAASTVHAIALSYIMLVLINLLATMSIGLGNLAKMLEGSARDEAAVSAGALWVQTVVWIIMSLVGVGWLTRRTLHQTVERLAIVVPRSRQVLLGLIVGVVMALMITVVLFIVEQLGLGDKEVERLSELLVGPLTQSSLGVLTLGLAAGIGEETLFRGALQPRFGLILTTLLFALLHSQYGLSFATVIVFLVGLVFGVLRQRTNTSSTMIAHAAYNISLVVVSLI